MLSKLESLGVKFTPVDTDKKNRLLASLENMVGELPKPYHDFLLHFGSNVRFDVMVSFKSIEPSPWADSNELIQ